MRNFGKPLSAGPRRKFLDPLPPPPRTRAQRGPRCGDDVFSLLYMSSGQYRAGTLVRRQLDRFRLAARRTPDLPADRQLTQIAGVGFFRVVFFDD